MTLKSPFPYFGGKSRAAALVWPRFGAVRNYVEPFFGSGAMLLGRPDGWIGTETVNDIDGLLSNFWRAIKADPEATAHYADWPVNENDLHARHAWLVERKDSFQGRLEGDPDFFDSKIAGWWAWGMACWIGGEFCSGKGPWHRIQNEMGEWILSNGSEPGNGIKRQRVQLSRGGRGVNRQLVHLRHAGRGVNRQRPVIIARGGQGVTGHTACIVEWFETLSDRFARVRVCCGDWKRVCGPTPTFKQGLTAVFLDPPYANTANREPRLYRCDSLSVAHDVHEWCLEHGDDLRMRIALCGYQGEHKMPRSWTCIQGKATNSGYASQKRCGGGHSINGHRERIWFSPHCLKPATSHKSANVRTALHVG
jgi:D12 class N6 adenine-specific DNA methyltransferase